MRYLRNTLMALAMLGILAFPSLLKAQQVYQFNAIVSSTGSYCTATQASCNIAATSAAFEQLVWNVIGTAPSACTVTADSSPDGTAWTTGGIVTSQTCTSSGSSTVVNVAGVNFARITVTITTTGAVQFILNGYLTNPSGGGASYPGVTTNGTGALNYAQGTITSSTPFINHTVTFNSGAVAFLNFLSNITCTASATGSVAAGWGIGGNQWQMKYGAANCSAPQLLLPFGTSSSNPSIGSSTQIGTGINFGNGSATVDIISNTNPVMRFANNQIFGGANAAIGWSSNTNPTGANQDTAFSRKAAGVVATDTTTAGNEAGLFRPGAGSCRVNSAITGSTSATNVCSWSLPALSLIWAFQCEILWQVSAGTTPTISFGINASQAPTTETALSSILTTNTGTQTNGSVTATASGNQNILTSPTLTPAATNFQAKVSGVVQASATAGTFAVTFTLGGTTPTGQITPGSSCLLY